MPTLDMHWFRPWLDAYGVIKRRQVGKVGHYAEQGNKKEFNGVGTTIEPVEVKQVGNIIMLVSIFGKDMDELI